MIDFFLFCFYLFVLSCFFHFGDEDYDEVLIKKGNPQMPSTNSRASVLSISMMMDTLTGSVIECFSVDVRNILVDWCKCSTRIGLSSLLVHKTHDDKNIFLLMKMSLLPTCIFAEKVFRQS